MRTYTTAGLMENIKRRGSIPADQSTLGEDEMLAIADDELQTVVAPMVMSLRADHFLAHEDFETDDEIEYEIPSDAMNRNLKSVVFVEEDGSEVALTRIELDDESSAPEFQRRSFPNGAYYIRGDVVKLYPRANPGKTLRMHFYRLPNQLVPVTEAAEVLSIDYDNNIVTTSGIPADWVTGDSVCCVKGKPGFTLRFAAQTASDVSSPTITVEDASDIVAGDWIALEGDSPIPQIPLEAHPILAQAALVKILEALGDPNIKISEEKLQQILKNYLAVASPRVEQAPPVFTSRGRLINHLR